MLAVLPGMKERGEGVILNVSSLAALNYFPGLQAYGMAKAALEHLTMDAAHQLEPHGIAVNTFRIDVPVASEGFLFNLPECRPLRLGTAGGRGRRHRVDVRATGVVHGAQRGHGGAARDARDHAVTGGPSAYAIRSRRDGNASPAGQLVPRQPTSCGIPERHIEDAVAARWRRGYGTLGAPRDRRVCATATSAAPVVMWRPRASHDRRL